MIPERLRLIADLIEQENGAGFDMRVGIGDPIRSDSRAGTGLMCGRVGCLMGWGAAEVHPADEWQLFDNGLPVNPQGMENVAAEWYGLTPLEAARLFYVDGEIDTFDFDLPPDYEGDGLDGVPSFWGEGIPYDRIGWQDAVGALRAIADGTYDLSDLTDTYFDPYDDEE